MGLANAVVPREQLDDAVADRLLAAAHQAGMTPEEFVAQAVDESTSFRSRQRGKLTLALLDDLARSDVKRPARRRWATQAHLP